MIAAIQSANQISPVNERIYRQSNLLGDWKGTWSKTHQTIDFKVLNIRGTKAQIEYTHNDRTERGFGTVNGTTLNFGNVTIATHDGKTGAMQSVVGSAVMNGSLVKSRS
ncbi:MAG: hypothetical protein JWN11_1674 [Hyphomicrobiales bacterium]|nr:hypothetical protein [Hyphomicrobiales bacterium]